MLKTLNVFCNPYLFLELYTCISSCLLGHHHLAAPKDLKFSMLKNEFNFCPLSPGPNPIHFLYPSFCEGCHYILRCLLPSSISVKNQILSILVRKYLLNASSPLSPYHNCPGFMSSTPLLELVSYSPISLIVS